MSGALHFTESERMLNRLARSGSADSKEVSVVKSPGARASAWAVKVKSNDSYNVYNIRMVIIGEPGSLPVEIGQQMQAVNLAESFTQTGQLSAGTYAVMFRTGDKYVFHCQV